MPKYCSECKNVYSDLAKKCKKCDNGELIFGTPDQVKLEWEEKPDPKLFETDTLDREEIEKLALMLINDLSGAGKYKKALEQGRFALFSIMGTEDWDDYAMGVLRVLMLKELMRMDTSLEEIKGLLKELIQVTKQNQ